MLRGVGEDSGSTVISRSAMSLGAGVARRTRLGLLNEDEHMFSTTLGAVA